MRTWVFGAKKGPTDETQALALQQLERAHRYKNDLIAVENRRRAPAHEAVLATLRAAPQDESFLPAKEKQDPLTAAKLLALVEDGKASPGLLGALWFEVRGRLGAEGVSALDAKIAEASEKSKAEVREARSRCGLYWGTYLVVEDDVQRAARTTPAGQRLRFARWDGTGTLAVQLQGGCPAAEVLSGADPSVRVVGEGRPRDLWLRAGSGGKNNREPVWIVFPFAYHREFPEGAVAKWVRAVCRRIGTKFVWSVQFVLDGVDGHHTLPAPTLGTVAVDVGWRRMGEGVRVAYWRDDGGNHGELRLPERLVERDRKVSDLRSIRDQNFNKALEDLLSLRRGGALPDEVRAQTEHAHAWRAPGKLAALAVRWRESEWLKAPGFDALEKWRKHDKHLLEWEANQRENVLLSRREQYRLFALSLAKYRKVVVEELDLRDFADLPGAGEKEDPRTTASRGRRFDAALSELLGCAADAVSRAGGEWVELDPAGTTATCASCGEKTGADAAASVEIACGACGQSFDQDDNACRNLLLRAAGLPNGGGTRSRAKPTLPAGESAAAVRRAKGLATRRTNRSKTSEKAL